MCKYMGKQIRPSPRESVGKYSDFLAAERYNDLLGSISHGYAAVV